MTRALPAGAPAWYAPPKAPADRATFVALLAFTAILITAPQLMFPVLQPLRLALVAALVAVATYLVPRLLLGRPLTLSVPEVRLAGCLGLWALVTIPFSKWPGGSFAVFAGNFLKTLVISWLLCNVVTTTARLRRVALLLALVAVPLFVTAFVQYAGGTFLVNERGREVERIRGYDAPLTSNPNDLALMLNVITPITIALATLPKPPLPRLVLGGIAALSAMGVVLTFSRAGFLELATISLLWMWRLRGRVFLEVGLAVAAAMLALLPLLPSGYTSRLATITNTEADATGSAGERIRDMVAATAYTATHPVLGAGLGMGTLALNEVRGLTWRKVHNVWLEIAVDLGVPGLILFILLVRSAFRSVREARDMSRGPRGDPDVAALSDGILISLAAFIVASLFHPVSYHLYFYYLAALAVAAKQIAQRAVSQEVHA